MALGVGYCFLKYTNLGVLPGIGLNRIQTRNQDHKEVGMARKPEYTLPGVPQHVIQRGHNREPCFFCVEDYQHYLDDLHEAASNNQAAIHAYVLMTNHVHILVTPGQPHSVTHMMQDLGRKYVRYINNRYKRSGTLWEG